MQIDLDFLSGKFLDFELTKEQSYLKKYFDSDIQFAVIKYFLVFGSVDLFTQHTGVFAVDRYVRRLVKRYFWISEMRQKAKQEMNFDLLWRIETGKINVRNKKDVDISK